ncbi:MAG: hypothetical protein P1V81_04025 [Planctomycetota bacterium]|nr:hypothetical protein [Planctomycetota bacterium]
MNTSTTIRALAALLLVALASCASYGDKTEDALAAFRRGDVDRAVDEYRDACDSAFLEGCEAGTVLLAAGRWSEARSAFELAQAAVDDLESKALLSVSDLSASLSSWVLNDTSLAYQGEGFERVYLHACLALCYLAEGSLQDVFVETRLANRLLETEEELYEREYAAGGLGHFLSAITYELLGQKDEAYIDYRRMADKDVGTQLAGPALVRLARDLGRDDDLPLWEARYGAVSSPPRNSASVVVIAGVGLAPFKEEEGLGVMTPDGLLTVVAPALERRGQPVGNLRLVANGTATLRTARIEEIHAVAEQNLDDRLLKIASKSIARSVAKRELTKALSEDHGILGRVAGDLFSAISERADLRFWQTLPDSWQAGRLFLEPGTHDLRLDAGPAGSANLGSFDLQPGETMFVIARTVDLQLFAHAVGGSPVAIADATWVPIEAPADQ